MPPKITDPVMWKQAELLMQPAFIRVIDNIRKALDTSAWKGSYQEVMVWAEDTTEDVKLQVKQLQTELETAIPQRAVEIRQTLAKLPTPHPGYHLCLQRQEQQIQVDLWELCYQVCFLDYAPNQGHVHIDTSLIDITGDVDWNALDFKAKRLITNLFANLPAIEE